MKLLQITLILFISFQLQAQNHNNIWCFGDSAGINFININNPIPIHSAVKSRGSCVSICDTNSNLLFYAYTRAGVNGNTTIVKNRNNQLMLNGNNVIGEGWYFELIIIPIPDDTTKYYLFTIGVTGSSQAGLYYSTINMNLDSGRGSVIQKNVQLLPDPANDGLIAVKHGNGRDWWILFRNYNTANNTFYKYLISPSGISGPFLQSIGTLIYSDAQNFSFNKAGNKLAVAVYSGLIETFDFDRCTGMLSNNILIRPDNTSPPYPYISGCALSPSGRFLYVSSLPNPNSYLIQIDLQDSSPWANADTLWSFSTWALAIATLKTGPNDKIYAATTYYDGGTVPAFPYADTVYNLYNMNLSVINSPDSFDTLCDFQPWSFYLGGNRIYWGLPNNPDYDMKPLYGSVCDSLSAGIESPPVPKGGVLNVTYVSDWDMLFVNANNLQGKKPVLRIIDMLGNVVYKSMLTKVTGGGYFTEDVNCSALVNGIYVVNIITEKEVLSKKFVKN